MLDNFDTYLLDLDGTLIDSYDEIVSSVARVLNDNGYDKDLAHNVTVGPPVRSIFAALLPDVSCAGLSTLVSDFREHYDSLTYEKTLLFPNSYSFLFAALERKKRLFIVTNKPQLSTKLILLRLKILHFFSGVYCIDSNGGYSDKSAMVKDCIEENQLAPKQTIIVGDSVSDIAAGKSNQLATAAVLFGYSSPECLMNAMPDYIVSPNFSFEAYDDQSTFK